tara:strand:- start:11 stop:625 length:615 start_codon:yes stop_codon:yes gene_type:complete
MNININTFNKWAELGKDKSMAENHKSSVNKMFEIINKKILSLGKPFNFLDLGCGNGWVVRKILKNTNCIDATGIDGAKNMIDIARTYKIGDFIEHNIEDYSFKKKFDIIFSMETFYYFNDADYLLQTLYKNNLNDQGLFIIGIDHYKENKPSLNWGDDYNLKIKTFSINEWKKKFKKANLKNINYLQHDKNKDWEGTLIIYGEK